MKTVTVSVTDTTTGRPEPDVNPRARSLRPLVVGGLSAACTLGLAGCGGSFAASSSAASGGSSRPIAVVAGENFWGNIASQIGGAHVKVTSIISDPNTDPHEYETDPNDAAAVARARFVIENG